MFPRFNAGGVGGIRISKKTVCLEKVLFRYLERKYTTERGGNGWRLYADYYTKLTLVDDCANITSFRRRKCMSQSLFQSLYGVPSVPPQGFTITNTSNLYRIAQFLKIEMYIVNGQNGEIWFNSCKGPLSEERKPIEWFTIKVSSNELYIHYTQPTSLQFPHQFSQSRTPIDGNFQRAFERIMQFPRQTCLPSPPGLSTNDFITHSKMLEHEYRINDTIIVFLYVGNTTNYNTPTARFNRVNLSQTFIYLGNEPTTELAVQLVTPLVLYGDYLCLPTLKYINVIRQQMLNIRPYIQRDNRHFTPVCHLSHLDSVAFNETAFCERRKERAQKRKLEYAKKAEKRKKRICGLSTDDEDDDEKQQQPPPPPPPPRAPIEKHCHCYICTKEAPVYNMSPHGQEQLTTIKTGCYDLLSMLGINTAINHNIINTLCQWSIASFDIEAMTQRIDNRSPLMNTFCRYNKQQQHHSYIGAEPQYATNIQKPIMIGHSDCFNANVDIIEITDIINAAAAAAADDDDTNGDGYVYAMVEQYWRDIILPRHTTVVAAKQALAQPLLDYLKKYNEAHVTFCTEQVSDRILGDVLQTYHHTLPGQLESRIQKLINQYIIFSFYGSGYDMVMLESYLIPYLYERGYDPKIDKKGEKVTVIRTRNGICFRDVTKLLAPSTNLRSFGALFNLSVEKGHFPFSILTSPASLQLPSLPKDFRTWQSELSSNGSGITQKEVNEALSFFKRSGFANVGQYLKHYLTLDVQILQQATDLWRQRLYTVIGLDFIDIEKYTISSLSNYAGNHKSATLCRPGWFFPNNAQMYALLKRGMRG